MYDCALHYASKAIDIEAGLLDSLGLPANHYCLATLHRAENTDDPVRLVAIVHALDRLSTSMPVVIPLHPRTRERMQTLALRFADTVRVISPAPYLDMVVLERNARVIMTDSGGVQKEAYFFQVPCVTLRDETEWVETVASGWNTLAGTDVDRIVATVLAAGPGARYDKVYGQGDAAHKCLSCLLSRTQGLG